MRTFMILVIAFAAVVSGLPRNPEKILGGSTATIATYPSIAALLYSNNLVTWLQHCGGIIVNTRSILTAASCPVGDEVIRWRVRVGSALSNSGGTIHNFMIYVIHSQYNVGASNNNDIAIMRTSSVITYVNNAVQPANIAGSNYYVPDNQAVSAVGWGATSADGQRVDRLNHVQIFTIAQSTCASRYREVNWVVTDNMLCSGMLDVGGRGQCTGDAGGPLYHNNVVVGIYSWGMGCGLAYYPGVSTRVTHYTSWIQLYS